MPRAPGQLAALVLLAVTSEGGRLRLRQERLGASALTDRVELASDETFGPRPAHSSLLEARSSQGHSKSFFDCSWFMDIINCDAGYEFVSEGSQAEAWRAQDKEGRSVVLKILYFRTGPDSTRFLLPADLRIFPEMRKRAEQMMEECELAQALAEGTGTGTGSGADRIVKCYSHNMKSLPAENTPLHLMLEDCGMDLLDFEAKTSMENNGRPLRFVAEVMRGVLEGIQFLQSFPNATLIHHDLKGENVGIKEIDGPTPGEKTLKVTLIDIGAMLVVRDGDEAWRACGKTASTAGTAPFEWGNRLAGRGGNCTVYNYDPLCPQAFDMFAVGSLMVHLLTLKHLDQVIQWLEDRYDKGKADKGQVWVDQRAHLLNFDLIWKHAQNRMFLNWLSRFQLQDRSVHPSTKSLMRELHTDEVAKSFLREALKCLAIEAKDRPTPGELLQHEFITRIGAPAQPQAAPE